jgi:hypothetical protein
MADAPEEVVAEIYAAPFGEFIARRDAAAKALRGEKRREEADAVKALRKPTLSAWAVNQLARESPDALEGLLAAGAALRQARGGDTMRDATRDERAAVDELASSAVALLRKAGEKVSEKTLTEIRDTLHAAALDDEARERIAAGRLVEPQQAIGLGGFGAFAGAAAPAPPPPRKERASKGKPPKEEKDAGRREEAAARRERLKAARTALRDAQDAVREHERELRSADREVADRERALEEAENALSSAQRHADAVRDALDEARDEFERRQAELDDAGG